MTAIRYSLFTPFPSRRRVAQHDRDALAPADAGAGDAVRATAALQLEPQRQHQPRAGGPERVADGDGAAVHVDALPLQPELLLHRQVLRRERFVDLEQIDLFE